MNIHSQLTPCVGVKAFIEKEGKLLILRHASRKTQGKPRWGIPGGHLEWDEDPIEGLKRETREELGVEINVQEIFYAWKKVIEDDHQIILIGYFAELVDPEKEFVLQPDDDQYYWMAKDELDQYFLLTNRQYREAILYFFQNYQHK